MFVALERLLNLHDGYRRVFRVAQRDVLLLVAEGRSFLLENRCPHQGAALHGATLSGRTLRCGRHGVEFDLDSGRALNAVCPGLLRLKLAYDGDRVGVDL